MNFSCFDPSVSPNCGDNFRIGLDCVCDFIPIASTFTNLIDLFQKHAYRAEDKIEASRQDSYWSYISNKDNLHCILLATPFFNIPVAIYYYFFSPAVGTLSKNISENFEANGSSSFGDTSSNEDISSEEPSKLEDLDEVKAALNSKSFLVPIKQNVISPLSSDESLITAFPKEIVSLILSYANCADPYSLSNAFKVSRLWSCVVKDFVRNAFRAEAFGNALWKECGGGEIVKNEDMNEEATSLSTFIDDIMKNIFKALYMLRAGRLVRMPKDLTLENIGALVKLKLPESGENGYQWFYPPKKQKHAGGSYWLWSSATRIKDSGNKSYPVQRKMASDRGYQDSHAREVAALCFAEFSLSGTFLCNSWYARCLDKRGTYPIVVGFGRSGLRVDDRHYGPGNFAVLGVSRWRPAEVRSSVLG